MSHLPTPGAVTPDAGAWLSGPCLPPGSPATEPVSARDIGPGDVVFIDGSAATITDSRYGWYRLDDEHAPGVAPGVALGWRAGSASGVTFRRPSDVLLRVVKRGGAR